MKKENLNNSVKSKNNNNNDNVSKHESENKKSKQNRRSNNDNENRNYECKCGKKYLSYPALYLHSKNMNSSPGNTQEHGQKNISESKGNKQRPSNNPDGDDMDHDTKIYLECINAIDMFLLFLSNIDSKFILELNDESIKFVEGFPFKKECPEIYENLLILKEEYEKGNEEGLKIDIDDQVKISENITAECYQEICIFIYWYQKTLNNKESMFKENDDIDSSDKAELLEDINKQKNQFKNFCESNNGNDMIYAVNDLLDDLPTFLREDTIYLKNTKLYKNEMKANKNINEIATHFSKWLIGNWYSNNEPINE